MNKLKPYQEPKSTQAYALQILARHFLETEIRAKQNHLYKETSTTQIPLTTSSHSTKETISHPGSTSHQSQETLDAEDLEMHRVMLEVYHIHPLQQEKDTLNPQTYDQMDEKETNLHTIQLQQHKDTLDLNRHDQKDEKGTNVHTISPWELLSSLGGGAGSTTLMRNATHAYPTLPRLELTGGKPTHK